MTRPQNRAVICLAVLVFASALSAAAVGPVRFLTGPQDGEPLDIAMAYIQGQRVALGLTAADLEGMVVRDRYTTRHNGVTHIVLQQHLEGIEVYNGLININIARDGSVINMGNLFVPDLANRVNASAPALDDQAAIQRAAEHFGLSVQGELTRLESEGGPAQRSTFAPAGLSRSDIPARLVYERAEDGSIRLTWWTVLDMIHSTDWWSVRVDAITGDIISQNNWTNSDSYLVIPFPDNENPDDSAQTVVVDPADPIASPFGWHDLDGAPGNETTNTTGNNVNAQDDLDGNNFGGLQPSGGPTLDFLETFDPAMQPAAGSNLAASIINLFYANNVMHDLTYQYGFDEMAGNFQTNTYGNGGIGNDAVRADAQDGAEASPPSFNNATFGTPGDGAPGVMSMFQWKPPIDTLATVTAPAGVAGEYEAASANFGPQLDATGAIAGTIERAFDNVIGDDGMGGMGTVNDGCEPLVGFSNDIALVDRGFCDFSQKITNAQVAGATGAIVANDRPGLLHMGAGVGAAGVTIPSVLISQADGDFLKTVITGAGTGTGDIDIDPDAPVRRDSDFDNGVIAHEYGHGISNRLTGGPAAAGCLGGNEQAGEGWSDFWSLMLTARATDTPEQARGIGNYLIFQDAAGSGIRNFPYSTDLTVNPQTYADIGPTNVPHGVGEIWMDMVWEVYWELVTKHGFDEDLYTGTGGNNLTIQLVIDGMKLQECLPDFVQARDAILLADQTNNGGANQCEIWRGFAKRGLGVSAVSGDPGGGVPPTNNNETEAFDIPAECPAGFGAIFADGFESNDFSNWSGPF
ncbi:MAG: M36 family metallopeptidase [Acidobacteriota bacterium]